MVIGSPNLMMDACSEVGEKQPVAMSFWTKVHVSESVFRKGETAMIQEAIICGKCVKI